MSKSYADAETVKAIRELAARDEKVRLTGRAYWDALGEGLTKADIRDAICSWIDAEKPVEAGVTTEVEEHIGELHYVMRPLIIDSEFYVKVKIERPDEWNEGLLIISAHK